MEIMNLLQILILGACSFFLLGSPGVAEAGQRRQGSKVKAKPKALTSIGGRKDTEAAGYACFQRDALNWRTRISPIAYLRTEEIEIGRASGRERV